MVVGQAAATFANLPRPLTSLVGREADVAAVRARLCDTDVRLVTLTGPPGVGKTRLAIEVTARLREFFGDGVVLVELAPLRHAAGVLPAIAQTLGMHDVEGIPPLEALQERLGQRHFLLVLDNFEHVLEAATEIASLLESCPHLSALVTSRAALRVRGEREYPVAPLALPIADSPGLSSERGAAGGLRCRYASPAVDLFVQRAADARPEFRLTDENAASIAEICHRLDGLPLALELAAARVRVLSVETLRARLASRLALLTDGARDLPERQRTLRGAITWSYELLTPAEQSLFRRLAIFAGGCTLDAATALGDLAGDLGIDVLAGVTSLLDKSLLTHVEGPDDEPRFGMLETVREFGLETLAASGETDALSRRHATYYAGVAAAAKAGFATPDAHTWLVRLDGDLANLRAALDWCLTEGEFEVAVAVLEPLRVYWQSRGLVGEAWRWAEHLLEQPESRTRPVACARLLRLAGQMAQIQGDLTTARARLAESVAIWRGLDDPVPLAESLRTLGWVLTEHIDEAKPLLEEAVQIFQQVGDTSNLALAYDNLATVMLRWGNEAAALHYAQESERLFRLSGDDFARLRSWGSLPEVAELRGDYATARAQYEERLDGLRRLGDRYGEPYVLVNLGIVRARQGDLAEATALLVEALALSHQLGRVVALVNALEVMALVAATRGDPARAARTFGVAEAIRERRTLPRPGTHQRLYEETVAGIRVALGEAAFATAWAEGRALSLDEAITYATEIAVDPTTQPVRTTGREPTLPDGLSAREVEVLVLLAEGRSNREIAEALVLSPRTVEHHLARIYTKINARGRAAAAAYAVRHNLPPTPDPKP
ncbi:MAG: tetratricopeptide repeat protein [Dehalococcoidia bacterium]